MNKQQRNEELRRQRMEGSSLRELAEEYDISHQRVSQLTQDIPAIDWIRTQLDTKIDSVINEYRRDFDVLDRFWDKVEVGAPDECWEWQNGLTGPGYGHFWTGEKYTTAHRFSWYLANWKKPGEKHVLHTCHNPLCVNPEHLYLGTPADNMRDRDMAGRNGRAKLEDEQVREIRNRFEAEDVLATELADEYEVGLTSVLQIVNGESYQWVK